MQIARIMWQVIKTTCPQLAKKPKYYFKNADFAQKPPRNDNFICSCRNRKAAHKPEWYSKSIEHYLIRPEKLACRAEGR